ncbi:MAG TPA: DUF3108 domain-containing protein [Gallionella sp.]|nr:DUF3108 domain-containing protein [Gallionella sp.]
MNWLAHSATWLLCIIGFPALAAPPAGIQATYDIYKDSLLIGRIDESYTRDQDRYTLTSTTTPLGLLAVFKPEKIVMHSNGLVDRHGLRPQLFTHRREASESSAEFNWQTMKLTLSQPPNEFPLQAGTQDRLSAMYQFMFLPLGNVQNVDFAMTNGRKLDSYHYAITRGEPLQTPAGKFDTLYLDSQAKPGESRTEIWLSVQQHYLPCKMIITDADGEHLTQILSKLIIQP